MIIPVVISGCAAAVGAGLRYLVNEAVAKFWRFDMLPLATLLINASGALVLGFALGYWHSAPLQLLIVSGIISDYTTFSTFINETLHLRNRHRGFALLYLGLSLFCGLGGAWLGLLLGK